MRARVYLDGFNLYYRLLKFSPYKWCNFKLLAEQLLSPDDRVEKLRYFTADVSPRAGDLDAPVRQATFFRALKTVPEIEIHKGSFLTKTIKRPLVSDPSRMVEVHDTEEKGSDVNLASHLLLDAFCDSFDVALVMSQDTDLLEPLRMVKEELGKNVVLAWFDKSHPGKKHRQIADAIRHVRSDHLKAAQFPDPVVGRGGVKISKPATW